MARPVLPLGVHFGDGLARWVRGEQQHVLDRLDLFARAGYQFVRTWTVLTGDYWRGSDVGPWTPHYRDHLASFASAVRSRGLKWLVSQGDLWQLDRAGREAVREALLSSLDRVDLVGMDGGNEVMNNGGASPAQVAEWLQPIARRWPDLILSTTSPMEGADEADDRASRRAWEIPPASTFDQHYLGDWSRSIRVQFNAGHERVTFRFGWASEPRGPGRRVSVHRVERVGALCAMAVAAAIGKQAFVYFCGPGVRSDEGERFDQMPGFFEVPRTVALLPPTLHAWRTTHGGVRAERPWFHVTDDPGHRTMRVDQAIDDTTGEAVALAYNEVPARLGDHRLIRGTITRTERLGDEAILYLGRVA